MAEAVGHRKQAVQLCLNGVSFTDVNNGVAVGGSLDTGEGIILRTTDGGNGWVPRRRLEHLSSPPFLSPMRITQPLLVLAI